MPEIILDDIFEAIRYFENSNPVLNLKARSTGYLIRDLSFNIMEMPNGKIGAFPKNMLFRFYRGENNNYDLKYPCVP